MKIVKNPTTCIFKARNTFSAPRPSGRPVFNSPEDVRRYQEQIKKSFLPLHDMSSFYVHGEQIEQQKTTPPISQKCLIDKKAWDELDEGMKKRLFFDANGISWFGYSNKTKPKTEILQKIFDPDLDVLKQRLEFVAYFDGWEASYEFRAGYKPKIEYTYEIDDFKICFCEDKAEEKVRQKLAIKLKQEGKQNKEILSYLKREFC